MRIIAHIDGGDELHISRHRAVWVNLAYGTPERVEINGQIWNPKTEPAWAVLNSPFFPRGLDVSNAKLVERKGRWAVQLERAGETLTVRFDDRVPPGGDEYLARVRIPLESLVRVERRCGHPAYAAGQQPGISRFRGEGADPEIVAGQRIVDGGPRANGIETNPHRVPLVHDIAKEGLSCPGRTQPAPDFYRA